MAQLFSMHQNKEGPGTVAPTRGSAGYFYKLGTFFWRFITLNCLFLLASIPVVTMPTALAATNRVCIKLIRDRNVLVWEEFRDEFKASWKKGTLMGLIFAAALFVGYYLLSLGLTNWENPTGVFFVAAGALVVAVGLVWAAYAFVLLASLDLPLQQLLRNARILIFLGRKWTLGVFAALLAMTLILWLFFPISLIVPIVGGIALLQYTICWCVNEPMDQYIIRPYNAAKAAQKAPED